MFGIALNCLPACLPVCLFARLPTRLAAASLVSQSPAGSNGEAVSAACVCVPGKVHLTKDHIKRHKVNCLNTLKEISYLSSYQHLKWRTVKAQTLNIHDVRTPCARGLLNELQQRRFLVHSTPLLFSVLSYSTSWIILLCIALHCSASAFSFLLFCARFFSLRFGFFLPRRSFSCPTTLFMLKPSTNGKRRRRRFFFS